MLRKLSEHLEVEFMLFVVIPACRVILGDSPGRESFLKQEKILDKPE